MTIKRRVELFLPQEIVNLNTQLISMLMLHIMHIFMVLKIDLNTKDRQLHNSNSKIEVLMRIDLDSMINKT